MWKLSFQGVACAINTGWRQHHVNNQPRQDASKVLEDTVPVKARVAQALLPVLASSRRILPHRQECLCHTIVRRPFCTSAHSEQDVDRKLVETLVRQAFAGY